MFGDAVNTAARIQQQAGPDDICVSHSTWRAAGSLDTEIIHLGAQSTSQIEATSFVNLWRSRCRLYRKHSSRPRMCLARWLVRLGMRIKALQTNSETLRSAYREARDAWNCG